jgi:hypothetical protein
MANKYKYKLKEDSTIQSDSFMSTGAGDNYNTKYAFGKPKKNKNLKEGPGATLGPGPKAGPEGVKDNMYVKKFKYKLVDRPALNKAAKGIEVKALWEANTNVEEYITGLGITNPDNKKFITSRILGFDKLESKLNELIPLLQQAKHKTLDFYKQDPNSFTVLYGTDIANDYLNDLLELFRD